jgi:hypothetical protein
LKSLVDDDLPVQVPRVHDEVELARILVHVDSILPNALMIDRDEQGPPAYFAVDRHAEAPAPVRRLVPGLPVQAEHPRVADERIRLRRST